MTPTKSIAYCCPFVPPEWIAAHGLVPVRVSPSIATAQQHPLIAAGVCSYAKAFVSEICDPQQSFAAVIFTTTCDQMRRAGEVAQEAQETPVFLMTVPATWQTATSVALYREELNRLGRFLVRLGGHARSDAQLAEQAELFDCQRRTLRERRGVIDGETFAEHLRKFQTTNQLPDLPSAVPASRDMVRLALAGGPLRRDDGSIFSWIRQAGGQVVLDATESGEMTLPPPFSRRQLQDDPLGEIVDAYFGQIPHAMRRPNSQLYHYFQTALEAKQIQGVIWQQTTWCDIWAAEAQRFAEWCPVPVLQWDTGDERTDHARIATRLEAFVEMLQS